MSHPWELSLAALSAEIGARRLSPLEATQSCLDRIGAAEPRLRAWTTIDHEGALGAARALTEELVRGRTRGSLHGIPLGVKDLIDVRGLPTTAGSRVLAGNVAQRDAPVVSSLRAGGAVVLGKTNTQEFAYGVVTPPTRNPWDLGRIPGGSSGGSGAALAARMCPAALGTDTAGSVRIPASLCGVTGLKPRPGIVPLEGIVPLAPSLDACGPMARSAADAALMWQAMSPAGSAGVRPEALRIARPRALGELGSIDPEVAGAVDAAIDSLCGAGATQVEVRLGHFGRWAARTVVLMTEALVVHKEAGWYPEHAAEYTEETRANLERAERFTAEELLASLRELEPLVAELRSVFEDADVVALPTTPVTAPTVDQAASADDGHRTPVVRSLTYLCGPVNVARLAAVSAPCGFTAAGLPVGLQLIAPEEATALGAALLYQSCSDFHLRRPPGLGAPGL